MEAIRKQASKLREQVAKQQQAVLKQLGHFGNEAIGVDEAELQCHQQLKNLYISTRAAKHFQKDIVHGVEGFISTSSGQMDIARKLAEDCCRYGNENESTGSLTRAALHFATSHNSMEKERETLLGVLSDQVSQPLRVLLRGAPLEDARLLTRHYVRLRQEVEAQMAEVLRRQSKSKDSASSAESSIKLQSAEAKLIELKSTMMALGREATDAMLSVEAQQQQITYKRLLTMVNAERSYHQSSVCILEKLRDEMILEKPQNGSLESNNGNGIQIVTHFIARVIHPFDAKADGELSLAIDDFVVVRQVASGWSEGECKGKAGWFPSAYVERKDKAPASKIVEERTLPI